MKKETLYWVSGIAVLTGMVTYFIYDTIKQSKKSGIDQSGFGILPSNLGMDVVNNIGNTISQAVIGNSGFPLKKGSVGANVRKLQTWLNKVQLSKLDVDGKFGDKTLAAVIKMQTEPLSAAVKNYISFYPVTPNPLSFGNEADKEQVITGEVSERFYKKFIG